jgi:hypothetical protein
MAALTTLGPHPPEFSYDTQGDAFPNVGPEKHLLGAVTCCPGAL